MGILVTATKKMIGKGNLALAGVQAASGIVGQIMQNRAQKKLAEYSYDKDLEMWNRQNEYNSPKAQMERLSEAGLNPNLVYGGSTGSSAGNSESAPSYNTPPYSLQLNDVIGKYYEYQNEQQNALNKAVERDLIRNQRDKTFYEGQTELLNQTLKELGIKSDKIKLRIANALADTQIEVAKNNARIVQQNVRKNALDYFYQRQGVQGGNTIQTMIKMALSKALQAVSKEKRNSLQNYVYGDYNY